MVLSASLKLFVGFMDQKMPQAGLRGKLCPLLLASSRPPPAFKSSSFFVLLVTRIAWVMKLGLAPVAQDRARPASPLNSS